MIRGWEGTQQRGTSHCWVPSEFQKHPQAFPVLVLSFGMDFPGMRDGNGGNRRLSGVLCVTLSNLLKKCFHCRLYMTLWKVVPASRAFLQYQIQPPILMASKLPCTDACLTQLERR